VGSGSWYVVEILQSYDEGKFSIEMFHLSWKMSLCSVGFYCRESFSRGKMHYYISIFVVEHDHIMKNGFIHVVLHKQPHST